MKQKGFTLVEVLVVIAIITILGFGAVSIAQHVIEKEKVSKTEDTIIRTLNGILEAYFSDTKSYPEGGIENLYETLEKNAAVRPLLAGLPSDCVQPLVYDWDGSAPNPPRQAIVIYDGWYASDDKPAVINLADDQGVGEPMRYIYRKGNFPQIRSAGKDRIFNTADDIVSTGL